jgi:hypothetical protein
MPLRPRSLVASAALLIAVAATATVAHAAPIDLAFDTASPVNGVFTPVVTADNQPLNTYTQNGFLVTQGSGQFDVNLFQGNPEPGITSGTDIGHATSSIVLTDGGAAFTLTSFDLDAYTGTASYSIVGLLGSTQVYDATGSDSTHNTWVTLPTGFGNDAVTSVTLTFTDTASGTEYSVDNLVVTPEPSSLILLGAGLLSMGAMARRRLFA